MPLIKNFKADNIRNAIILNSLYFTVITVTTITVNAFFTKLFEKKEESIKIKKFNDNIDKTIHKLHVEIQKEHTNTNIKGDENKIKVNENKIIELINDKHKNLSKIIRDIKLYKDYIRHYKKSLYKTSNSKSRHNIINNILLYTNTIKRYSEYINIQSKVSIRFKTELIILVTIVTSFLIGFLIYILFYLIVGYGGGMLTPCSDKIKCSWN
tara:strand:+ start:609 stop:1241 length:633 start_codon:yes stop_codon:yes gene_type:complete